MTIASVMVLGTFTNGLTTDNVELNVLKTLQLETTPIDMAISPDGRQIFVLNDQGEVVIYSPSANMEAKIDVGKLVDQIKLGPRAETLILKSSKNKTLQIVTLDFIQKIDVPGSPFKGPEDATVVIAVFDDFQ